MVCGAHPTTLTTRDARRATQAGGSAWAEAHPDMERLLSNAFFVFFSVFCQALFCDAWGRRLRRCISLIFVD